MGRHRGRPPPRSPVSRLEPNDPGSPSVPYQGPARLEFAHDDLSAANLDGNVRAVTGGLATPSPDLQQTCFEVWRREFARLRIVDEVIAEIRGQPIFARLSTGSVPVITWPRSVRRWRGRGTRSGSGGRRGRGW